LIRKSDSLVNEWRGAEQFMEELKASGNNYFLEFFDWQRCYYAFLEIQKNYSEINEELESIFNQNDWQMRLSKRGVAFFFFLSEWA